MLEHPWWLAALALLPVVRWLHQHRAAATVTRVAAVFLWRSDTVTGTRGDRKQPPDPAWRRRAAIVALLVLALAGPRWPGNRGAPVVVWVDDSQSLYARDGNDTRMARALHALSVDLDAAAPAQIEVRSLADPTAVLDLTATPAAGRAGALADWTRAPRGEPHLPLPVALDTQREHWLVTDGADTDVARWAESARLARIVQAGTECTNAAVTLLALREPIEAGAQLAGLVEVTNGCNAATQRHLRIQAGNAVVLDESLSLGAQAATQRAFTAPGYLRVRATLDARDPLPLDDALEIDAIALAPVATRLVGRCPASVETALRAHPRLQLGTSSPALEIDCGDVRTVSDGARHIHLAAARTTAPVRGPLAWMTTSPLQALALDPQWLRRSQRALDGAPILTDGETLLITRNAAGLDVGLMFGLPPFHSRPEQAALLAGLIDEAMGRELLGETVRATLPVSAARIEPLPLPMPSPSYLTLSSTRSIAQVILAAALLVLLYDLVRTPGVVPRLVRGVVALLCVLAWWNPTVPFRKAPLDVALLLDESQSMPAGSSEKAWQRLRSRALPADSRVSVTRFGAAPVDEGSFDTRTLPAHVPARFAIDASRTDIAAALVQALRDGGHENIVVLASDALENTGDAATVLAQARAAGIPVLLLAPENAGTSRASIDTVNAPANALAGQPIPLAVQITTPAPATLEIDDGGRSAQWPVASGTRTWQVWLEPAPERSRTISLRLLDVDGGALDERVRTLTLGGEPSVLVVTRAVQSALAESLQAGGRHVRIAAPGAMEQALEPPDGADVVILDDIAADEASEAGWSALARAVRAGAGLAVLGGSHSFMAGRYHGATIETLLPVISSPPRQQAAAAVMFVIDKSGSMGRETTAGATRFDLARQAVLDSARVLPSSDVVGLVAFDVSTRTALPLQAGGAAAIERIWTFTASGGTALAPALDAAITDLAAAAPEQRLLVLATDGFAPDESLDALIARIEHAHIDVIALAIGDEPDLSVLTRLTAVNDGALERVTDVATLPRLMSAALAGRRAGVERGHIEPMQRLAPPFFTGNNWPALDAYAVTTPRPGARVYLASPLGDPLIAMDERGAGRVVALTAGLDEWAHGWQTWPRLPALLGGMIDWLGTRTNAGVHAEVVERGAMPWLEIDAAENDRWSSASAARVTWLGPADRVTVVAAEMSAPGHFRVRLPAAAAGDYRAEIEVGGARTSALYTRASTPELHPDDAARSAAARWLSSGLLQPWPEGLDAMRAASDSSRNVLLVLALVLFVASLLGRMWRLLKPTVPSRNASGRAIATART